MNRSGNQAICVAITGASGARYGLRLVQLLLESGEEVYLLVSRPALVVIATEEDLSLKGNPQQMQEQLTELFDCEEGQLSVFGREQWFAPVASGSNAPRAMVVCPCSTSTLSAIAIGASNSLLERAADVMLKERRQLILVPRETPYSTIHLQHMLTLSQIGATIMPASPAFYHRPGSIHDLIDFVVARILDHLGVEQAICDRWGDES